MSHFIMYYIWDSSRETGVSRFIYKVIKMIRFEIATSPER